MLNYILGVALAVLPTLAKAQERPSCIRKEEAAAAVVAVLPIAIATLADRCSATLPQDAFLNKGSRALVERLRREGGEPKAAMASVFQKIAGIDLPAAQTGEAMLILTEAMVKAEVAKLKTDKCADANDIAEAMAPLPTANVGQLVAAILSLTATDPKKKSDLPICRADG